MKSIKIDTHNPVIEVDGLKMTLSSAEQLVADSVLFGCNFVEFNTNTSLWERVNPTEVKIPQGEK